MTTPILQNGPLLPWLEDQLAQRYDIHKLPTGDGAAAWLRANGAKFEVMATSAKFGASRALVDALPDLKMITSFGVGYETFDLAQLKARGIPVGYTPEVLNDCVADTAMGLVINAARRNCLADRYVREGKWPQAQFMSTTRVSGKKMGIVGLGRIGKVVARRATGFDMEIRYHNRRPVEGVPYGYEPSLPELARWCDFLVVVAAAGDSTRGLVGAQVLEALGPKGFLVNVARGSVVDQKALIKALQDKTIAGAGLDVYEDEPNVPPELIALDNVALLPHVASNTNETRRAMGQRALDNLEGWQRTGTVPVAVPMD